ncbi:MAG: protein translocase subunit SecD [Candidatus Paceibacterota bacterium]
MLTKYRIASLVIILLLFGLGYFIYATETAEDSSFPFRLGLDLSGGTELIYEADVSALAEDDTDGAMQSLRTVIERRVDAFGVASPIVQTEQAGFVTGEIVHRLIVELPGVTDIEEATAMIGETPVLEFKLLREGASPVEGLGIEIETNEGTSTVGSQDGSAAGSAQDDRYEATGLTGRYLEDAQLQFNQTTGEPYVSLQFNRDGAGLFAEITRENQGRILAIFLDGKPISQPVIRDVITNGQAQISGGFSGSGGLAEARELMNNLKFGALPVPIELVNTQTIGPTLGQATLDAGVIAGLIGLGLVILFLILWYRLPGVVAAVSLSLYVILMLALFKVVPVTLTAAGIAGFILSVGMAVDANVLIFERFKEERRAGRDLIDAIHAGFSRAWPSIRDANISSIISAVILYWLGTSLVKGFALVFGLGVLVSMLTAISVSRTLLLALAGEKVTAALAMLFGTGLSKH